MHNLHQFSYARAEAETVNLRMASTAMQDDVPQQTLGLTALFHSQIRLTDANDTIVWLLKKGLRLLLRLCGW